MAEDADSVNTPTASDFVGNAWKELQDIKKEVSRAVRAPDSFGAVSELDSSFIGKFLSFDVNLNPVPVTAESGSSVGLAALLASSDGADNVGISAGGTLQAIITAMTRKVMVNEARWGGEISGSWHTAFNAAAAYAKTNKFSLQLMPGEYNISDTCQVEVSFDMTGAVLQYVGPKDRPALRIGSLTAQLEKIDVRGLHVLGHGFTGAPALTWPVVAVGDAPLAEWPCQFSAVQIVNVTKSHFQTIYLAGCTAGLHMLGVHPFGATAYNNIYLGMHENCKYPIYISSSGTGAGLGWVNENKFFGGALEERSTTFGLGEVYGITMSWNKRTGLNASYRGQNQNHFYGPCFELGGNDPAAVNRLPVFLDGVGGFNRIYDARVENCRGPFAIIDGNDGLRLRNNIFEAAFTIPPIHGAIDGIIELNGATANIFRGSGMSQQFAQDASITDFGALVSGYDATSAVIQAPAWFMSLAGAVPVQTISNASIELLADGTLVIPNGAVVGVTIDTTRVKRWIIKPGCRGIFQGRLALACKDSTGAALTSAGPGHPYAMMSGTLNYSTNFGGCYTYGGDSSTSEMYTFGPDVAYVHIMIAGGTNSAHVQSLGLTAICDVQDGAGNDMRSSARILAQTPPGNRVAAIKPDTGCVHGVYKRGDPVWNAVAAVGVTQGWVPITTAVGYLAKAWVANTNYTVVGTLRENGGEVYKLMVVGIAAAAGGPAGTGTGIVDGGCTWNWVGKKAVFTPMAVL